MKKKKLQTKLMLNKRNVSELNTKAENNIKGGATFISCPPYCATYYSCKCTQPTYYIGCTGHTNQCTLEC